VVQDGLRTRGRILEFHLSLSIYDEVLSGRVRRKVFWDGSFGSRIKKWDGS
jgi:hypothetical protein